MRILLYVCKSRLETLISFQSLNHYCLKRSFTIISATDSSALRTSFLQNKCGLSGKSLIRASNLLNFEPSDERPLSVLQLFQTFGFPQPNITKIISSYPHYLQFHSQKTLKPKLDFLVSVTQSQTDVVNMVTRNPNILGSSLKNQLLPAFNLLYSLTGTHQNAAAVLKCKPNLLSSSASKCILPNIEFLRTLGVPGSQIVKLTTGYGTILGKKHEDFCEIVMRIKEMGFNLSSSYFICAVQTLCLVTDSALESRFQVFRSLGFSNDEILHLFKKVPSIFSLKQTRIKERLEFFIKKLQWSLSRLLACPVVLVYSLEKRAIPRYSVLQLLVSKNSTTKSFTVSTILCMAERKFLKLYVTPNMDEIPEIMDAYQGKLKFDVYSFRKK